MQNERDRLIEILKIILPTRGMANGIPIIQKWNYDEVADKLLEKGIIVAPMPMAEWLRKELTEYVHQRCMEEL